MNIIRNTILFTTIAVALGLSTLAAPCKDKCMCCNECTCSKDEIIPHPPKPDRTVISTTNNITDCYVLDLNRKTVAEVRTAGPCLDEYKLGKILFKKLRGGTYTAGSPTNEIGRYSQVNNIDFEPQHRVTVTNFAIAVFEITQKQYQIVTGEPHGNKFVQPDRAKDYVSWIDAHLFINLLNKSIEKTGWKVALPSEAQWEYACRAGVPNTYPFSATNVVMKNTRVAPGLERYASYLNGRDANVVRESVRDFPPVGAFLPNPWDLYDMHGGVWEWCEDAWTVNGTKGMKSVRGGGYWFNADDCRAANRHGYVPTHRNHGFGFRIVLLRK